MVRIIKNIVCVVFTYKHKSLHAKLNESNKDILNTVLVGNILYLIFVLALMLFPYELTKECVFVLN